MAKLRTSLFLVLVWLLPLWVVDTVFADDQYPLPSDDAWVDVNNPASTHDEDNGLQPAFSNVFGNFVLKRLAYLRFDVTEFCPDATEGELRLYVESFVLANDLAGEDMELYAVGDDWNGSAVGLGSEIDLAHNSAPPLDALLDTQSVPEPDNWLTFSSPALLSHLSAEAQGDGVVSMAIRLKEYGGSQFGGGIRFEDRENTLGTAKRPELACRGSETRAIEGPGVYSFTTTGAEIEFVTENVDSLTVEVSKNFFPTAGQNTVKRSYNIIANGGSGDFEANLTLAYDQVEFDASVTSDESLLSLYRRDQSTWLSMGVTSVDPVNNLVTLEGVSAFSEWVISDQGPMVVSPRSVQIMSETGARYAAAITLILMALAMVTLQRYKKD